MKHFQHILSKKRLKYFLQFELFRVSFTRKNMGKLVFYPIHFLSNLFLFISNKSELNYFSFYVNIFLIHLNLI